MQLADKSEAWARVPPLRARLSAWLGAARDASVRLLRVGSILHRNADESIPPAKAWTETLGRVISDLDLLNHDTEQDFRRIGGRLAEFIEAVNLISSGLTAQANQVYRAGFAGNTVSHEGRCLPKDGRRFHESQRRCGLF